MHVGLLIHFMLMKVPYLESDLGPFFRSVVSAYILSHFDKKIEKRGGYWLYTVGWVNT